MGTRATEDSYIVMQFVVVLLLQATVALASPLDKDQDRFFDLCEKITQISTKDGKGWIHPIKDWICGTTTTSTIPPTTTEEVTTTTSTIPPTTTEEVTTTTTEEVTTTTSTIPPTTTEEVTTTTTNIPPTTTEEVTTT